jgi:hypothetical protein
MDIRIGRAIICEAVNYCEPLLIYFEPSAWRSRITNVAAERGDRFNDLFFDAFYRSPWGRKYSAYTSEDVLTFYEYYLRICDRLLEDWPYHLLRFNPIELGPNGTIKHIMAHIMT